MSEKSFLIAGLGNVGREYALTRHNIGFLTLDAWAQASNVVFSTSRYGDMAAIRDRGRTYHLLKPSTYMNLSGQAVRYWINELNIPIENLLVICDEINLPFGTLRLRKSGSDGGHNGLKNIEELLQTREFARLRMGVGHEFEAGGQVEYVLGNLSESQLKSIPEMAAKISEGIRTWVFAGMEKAMTYVNSK